MNLKFKIFGWVSLLLFIVSIKTNVFSYAYNPFSTLVPEKNVYITFWNWAGNFTTGFSDGAGLFVSYGINNDLELDLFVIDLSVVPFGLNNSAVMLRYNLGNNNIIGAAFKYSYNNTFSISPQYHYVLDTGNFVFEFNLKGEFSSSDFTKPIITAYIAPVYKMDKLAIYLELDPIYDFSIGFMLDVIPGIAYTINDYNILSLGISLGNGNILSGFSPAIAFWYNFGFGL